MTTLTDAPTQTTVPAGTWAADPVHSSVSFRVRNMGIVTVSGHFAEFEGTLTSDGTLAGTKAEGSVEVPSVHTRSEKRDQHLLSDDFFAAEQHPQIRFASTKVEPADNGAFRVTGDLTIKGTTRAVEFLAEPETSPIDDPWGGTRIGLHVTGEIDRRDYGVEWDVKTPAGIPLASYKVKLDLDLGFVKSDES